MLPGADGGVGGAGGGGNYEGAGRSKENSMERDDNASKQRQGGQIKIRNIKVNHMQKYEEKYKWPYYDSYAPNVAMHKPDEQIVKKSISKQYYPSETGHFTMKHLHARQAGIRKLEKKYIERVKSANSPSKSVDGIKSLKFRNEKMSPRQQEIVL